MRLFNETFEFLLSVEGGYVNHPQDPGKATNMGVTKATLERWRGHAVTDGDVADLSKNEAREIYRHYYWDPAHCPELPHDLAIVHFDTAVHSGVDRATRMLQSAVGSWPDGIWGPNTAAAVAAVITSPYPNDAATMYITSRLFFLTELSSFEHFGRGWINRIAKLQRFLINQRGYGVSMRLA